MNHIFICFRPILAAFGAAALVVGCGKGNSASETASPSSQQSVAVMPKTVTIADPCTLLSATEAQAYVGALIFPPFRATDDGVADVAGNACAYRGAGARQLIIVRTGEGSAAAAKIANEVPNIIGGALEKAGAGNLADSAHRVMADIPGGPWDKATWIPGGTLFVTKGNDGANIDVSGGGTQSEAVAIARLIVPRLDHPLDYDGAKAAAAHPAPKANPPGACEVVTSAAVEHAIGPLDGAPRPDSDGSKCSYQVATHQGPRTYQVDYVWRGGTKNFNMLKNSMSTLGSVMGGNIPTAGMDSMKMDPNMSKMMGGLMKLAGAGDAAPGAATQVGFKTDTNLQGPWDSAMLMHGTQLFAVKNDIMVGMDLRSADYEKAKALLAVICSSL